MNNIRGVGPYVDLPFFFVLNNLISIKLGGDNMSNKKVISMDPRIEREIIGRLINNSLSFSLIWIYNNLHSQTKDFDQFNEYIHNSKVIREEFPFLINAMDGIRDNKSKNHLGSCMQCFFNYINCFKKSRELGFFDNLKDSVDTRSEEMDEMMRLLHEKQNDELYCIDFNANASFVIKLNKDNKFIEVNNVDRTSCIVLSTNNKEAYELFKTSEHTPIRTYTNDKIYIYGVRFDVTKEIEDVYSNIVTGDCVVVSNPYLIDS